MIYKDQLQNLCCSLIRHNYYQLHMAYFLQIIGF